MSITSYSQNFEDVMLWRALSHIEQGFYIDIGAQHPLVDSVSLLFHESGWRGIHVEPTPTFAELLRQQRPGDTVIQAVVGDGPAVLTFYEIPGTGISTADPEIAAQHRKRGFETHELIVPCISLSAVFDLVPDVEVQWLKIDVEGYEAPLLASWGTSKKRPWIVVIESTIPLTRIETRERWEHQLRERGYIPVYFDGLNRFYVSEAHIDLTASFVMPPNLFDDFSLSGTANNPFHTRITARAQEQLAVAMLQTESARKALDEEHAHRAELERNLRARVEQTERECESLRLSLTRQELAMSEMTLRHLEAERQKQTEHDVGLMRAESTIEQLLREAVAREAEHTDRILKLQETSRRQMIDLEARQNEAMREATSQRLLREQLLVSTAEALHAELAQLRQTASWRVTAPFRLPGEWIRRRTSLQIKKKSDGAGNGMISRDADIRFLLALDYERFVEAAYVTILRRLPDPGGFSYYLGRRREGAHRLQLLREISESEEAHRAGVHVRGMRSAIKLYRLLRSLPLFTILLGRLCESNWVLSLCYAVDPT